MTKSRTDPATLLWRIFFLSLAFNGLVLVAFIVGSMLFTGGQMGESDTTKWQPVWYWPVFPVPAWLLIIPAAIAAIVVIPLCIVTPAAQAPRLLGGIGVTAASAVSAIVFMIMFPSDSGVFPLGDGDTYLGLHWIALALTLWCAPLLIIGAIVKGTAYERMRKAGTLPR